MTHSNPSGTIAQRRPAEQTALALFAILALLFSTMALLAAQPTGAATVPAVLALSEDCNQTALHKQIDWSGNDTDVIGDMHSNAGITVSGARNDVSGAVTFDDTNCNFVLSGSDNTGGILTASNAGTVADPGYAVPTEEDCDFVWTGSDDVDLLNEDVWLDSNTLEPGLYCHLGTGKLQQSGQGKDGTVSFFANGHIDLSNGSNANYTPFRADQVLTHSLANSVDAVTLAGSGTDANNRTHYNGIIYAPFGEAETGGQWITIGCLVAETVKLNGSDHIIGTNCGSQPPAPVLELTKTNNTTGPVAPGTPVNFTITVDVTNGPAAGSIVKDVLPPGYDAPSPISDSGSYSAGNRTITWGPLSVADGDTFTYTAAVSAGVANGTQLVNVAVITSPGTNCPPVAVDQVAGVETDDPCEDDSIVTVVVPPAPTITVDKTANPLSLPEPGGNFTFTVVVNNTSAEAVTITSLDDDIYGTLAGDADCQVGTVLAATTGSCTFSFVGAFAGDAGDSQTDVVTACADDNDENEACDDDDANVTITDIEPLITVEKTADPLSLPEPGGDFTFTVVVTNNAAEAVTIASLTDDIYGDLDGDADCQVGTVLAANGGSCTFSFVGEFTGENGDSQTDIVTVCADDNDENQDCDDDDATVVISQTPVPGLVIDKVADATVITISGPANAPVATPSIVTWTLTYTLTNGPVHNAVITDVVPVGFTFLDSPTGTHAAGTVTWNLGTLTTGGSVTFRTTVNVATISRVAPTVNTAVIDSDETLPDNGVDSVTVTVQPPPLGGNPAPTPRTVPNTATGLEIGGAPVTMPIVLVVLLLVGSLGAFAFANVRSRRNRQI